MKDFGCDLCVKKFSRKYTLVRHSKTVHSVFPCSRCEKKFTTQSKHDEHYEVQHRPTSTAAKAANKSNTGQEHPCKLCKKIFKRTFNKLRHEKKCSNPLPKEKKLRKKNAELLQDIELKRKTCQLCNESIYQRFFHAHLRSTAHIEKALKHLDDDPLILVHQTAFKNNLIIYRISAEKESEPENISLFIDVRKFMKSKKPAIRKIFLLEFGRKKIIKYRCRLNALYQKTNPFTNEIIENSIKSFESSYSEIYSLDEVDQSYANQIEQCHIASENYEHEGSGWTIVKIIFLFVEMCEVNHLKTGSFIELPPKIIAKKWCVNVKNVDDNLCFIYSILSERYYNSVKTNRNSPEMYKKFMEKLDYKHITFPIEINEIASFEKANPEYSINVFTLDADHKVVGPLYHTKSKKTYHTNLLMLNDSKNSHFVNIHCLSRLIRSQITAHHGRIYVCDFCLMHFSREEDLLFHEEIGCGKLVKEMPIEKPYLEFTNMMALQKSPIAIYGDFECILPKFSSVPTSTQINPEESHTENTHLHVPAAYGYKTVIAGDEFPGVLRLYRGEDCIEHFINTLHRDLVTIYERILTVDKPMEPVTDAVRLRLRSSLFSCMYCKKDYSHDDGVNRTRVLDHDHFTGKIRGYACQHCNLLVRKPRHVSFYLHNGSSYDFSLMIRSFTSKKIQNINVIPKHKSKYIAITVDFKMEDENEILQVRFTDSYRLLAASLSTLGSTISRHPLCEEFLRGKFGTSPYLADIRTVGKQHMCYEYFDSFERFKEKNFPPIEAFYNQITGAQLDIADYNHAVKVFRNLKRATLGDYVDFYLTIDVLLLADVMEEFRKTSFERFKLDPTFYYTIASYSFDVCLYSLGKKIGLITDSTMFDLIKNSMRGGVCSAITKHGESNNEYCKGGYDSKKGDKTYSIFLDMNSLYGYTMSNYPFVEGEYEWVEDETEIMRLVKNLRDIGENSPVGYIFCVDLSYPPNLHNLHNDFPLCPEQMKIGKVTKLVPNLWDKKKYTLHYLHLKLVLSLGMKLIKVHKCIKFKQSMWLSNYIKMCADLRKTPGLSKFEIQLYKDLVNVIYGKMIQSSEYIDVKLVREWRKQRGKGAVDYLKSPFFKSFSIFDENLVGIEMRRLKNTCDRPITVGWSVLELSKVHLYSWYYNFLLKKIDKRLITLNYCDTDSILITTTNYDIYKFMKLHPEQFDTSDYPKNNKFKIIPQNRKIPGILHDEGAGLVITRFFIMAPKAYVIEYMKEDGMIADKKKLKSVCRSVTKNLMYRDYHEAWKYRSTLYKQMFRISSKDHVITTISQNKRALDGQSRGEKRYFLEDNTHSLAYGHKECPIKIDELRTWQS